MADAQHHTLPPQAPDSSDQPLLLLDLPKPWLAQLWDTLGAQELVLMLRSSPTVSAQVLHGRCVQYSVQGAASPSGHIRSMQLADSHSQAIHVLCKGPRGASEFFERAQTLGQQYHRVTRVTLQGLTLDSLIPSWLRQVCPHLTSLHLQDSNLQLPLPAASPEIPQNTTLQHLAVQVPLVTGADVLTTWQHHIQALKALTSLSITHSNVTRSSQVPVFLQCVTASVRAQLTSLMLSALSAAGVAQQGVLGRCLPTLQGLPALTTLQLPGHTLHDPDVACILQLPALRAVECQGLSLMLSHTEHPCSWAHLSVDYLQAEWVGKLPLASLQGLTLLPAVRKAGAQLEYHCELGRDACENAELQKLSQRVGGIQWGRVDAAAQPDRQLPNEVTHIVVSNPLRSNQGSPPSSPRAASSTSGGRPREAATALAVVAELLSTYRPRTSVTKLYLATAVDESGLVDLARPAACTSRYLHHHWDVHLEVHGSTPADVWAQLPKACRRYIHVEVSLARVNDVTHDTLLQFLRAAPRPSCLTVQLKWAQLPPGWAQRAKEGLQTAWAATTSSAGHHLPGRAVTSLTGAGAGAHTHDTPERVGMQVSGQGLVSTRHAQPEVTFRLHGLHERLTVRTGECASCTSLQEDELLGPVLSCV